MIVDDSTTARNQVKGTLSQLGLEIIECRDGMEAYNLLKSWCDQGKTVTDEILLMITDAEMPEMDGYRLTYEVRNDARMKDLFITLNTSLSGSFNEAMVKKLVVIALSPNSSRICWWKSRKTVCVICYPRINSLSSP